MLDLDLAGEEAGLAVAGQVLVNGAPRAGVEVAVYGGAVASTDHEGRFRVVRVELPEWGTVAVRAPDLDEDDEATVQFVAADGRAYRDVDSSEAREAWVLSPGGAMAVHLPAGVWTVRMTTSDGRVRESQVTVGADRQVLVE